MGSVSESYAVSYGAMATSRFISFLTRSAVSVFLILLSIGLFAMLVSTKPELAISSGDRSLPAVIVLEAQKIPIARRTIGYGTAEAIGHAEVSAQVTSTVLVLPPSASVGLKVKKGDLLVELDPNDYEQNVLRAQLAVNSAQTDRELLSIERSAAEERADIAKQDQALADAELARVTEAALKGAAKQREVDLIKQKALAAASSAVNAKELADRFPSREEILSTTIQSRKAELQLAEENLRRCKILSPIDGVLQEVDVRVGEHVVNGTRIAKIVNSTRIEISLRLPSYARSYVQVHDSVSFRSAGFGKRYWNAYVSRIAPEDDSQTRTMVVYVDVEQNASSPTRIPSGLFVRGEVHNASRATLRWAVPRRAIRDDRVMVVRDNVLRSIPVVIDFAYSGTLEQLGLPDVDWAILETPLVEGDLIVVDPGGSLRDGMGVRALLATEVTQE
jgi:RND family efflux transporter MFP subunit